MVKASDVIVISPGQEFQHRKTKRAVATSKVQISFDNKNNMEACAEALRASDQTLANQIDPMYQWDCVIGIGNSIYFGVTWYDRTFFDEKKDVFTGKNHQEIFSKFGASADDFVVQHFLSID